MQRHPRIARGAGLVKPFFFWFLLAIAYLTRIAPENKNLVHRNLQVPGEVVHDYARQFR